MKRLLLLSLLVSAIAPAAFAHWAVRPTNINVAVGETMTAQPYWDHGTVMYEDRDDFASDDANVAIASGWVGHGVGGGGITVTGIRPGVAHIVNTTLREVVATITVSGDAIPLQAVAAPSSKTIVPLNTAIDLHVVTTGWPATSCAWYLGTIGDTSRPLSDAGVTAFTYNFYAKSTGTTRIWASVGAAGGIATVQYEIETPDVKRRVARH
jgi:hypothetical protein